MLLLAWDDLPQIARNSQKLLLGDGLPQISQICTDAANFRGCTCLRSALPLARARSAPTKQTKVLPQIAQNSQNLLLGMTSHRFHRFAQMVRVRKIVAEVSGLRSKQSC